MELVYHFQPSTSHHLYYQFLTPRSLHNSCPLNCFTNQLPVLTLPMVRTISCNKWKNSTRDSSISSLKSRDYGTEVSHREQESIFLSLCRHFHDWVYMVMQNHDPIRAAAWKQVRTTNTQPVPVVFSAAAVHPLFSFFLPVHVHNSVDMIVTTLGLLQPWNHTFPALLSPLSPYEPDILQQRGTGKMPF